MRMNKYLASTLFTGLFVTATFLPPAMGQEQSLQPQGAWALTKIDRSAQGGTSYCTLSRRYDDGIVLSLGRNQTEEYSLAIDFQKPVFTKDKSLKINLQPGPGQIRAYDMMPSSEKAVVVRLGWDTGFFDSLNQSQQMKVKIADKGYSFAMPEIAKGQDDLEGCMEGLQAAGKGNAKTAQTKDVLNAQAGSTTKEFDAGKVGEKTASAAALPSPASIEAQKEQVAQQEKTILKEFAESIKSQEPSLNNDDGAPRRNFATKGDDKGDEKKAVQVADAVKAKAPMPGQAVQQPELVKRPPPVPVPTVPAPVIAAKAPVAAPIVKEPEIAAKLAATSPAAEFKRAEEDQRALQKADAELKAAQARMNQIAAENEALKAKAAAPTPDMQKQIAAMQAEKIALQQKLDQAQQEKDKLAKPEDVAAAQAKAKELEIKNAQLEDSLRKSQVRIAEAAVNTETKSLRRVAELETRLEAAQKDNTALARQLDSFKLQQEDKSVALVAGDWDLEKATKRYNEAEREIRRIALQLEQARTNCNREKAEIEQMLFDPAVTDKQQIERLTSLEDQLEGARAEIAALKAQPMQQGTASTQEVATLREQNKALSDTLAAKEKALIDAKVAQLKGANPKQAADLQAMISSVKNDNAMLNDQNIVLRAEADKLRLQLVDATSNGSTRADKVASIQLENESLKRQAETKDTQTATYQNQLALLQQENAQLKNRLSVADSGRGRSTEEVGQLTRQIQTLQNQVSGQQTEKQSMDMASAARAYNNITPAAGSYATPSVPPVQAQPIAAAASGAAAMAGYDKSSVQSLLQKSGLNVSGMSTTSKGFSGADNFSWTEGGNVRGLASIKMLKGATLDAMTEQYIAYQRSQCSGDFASMPSPSGSSRRMALYEMACVNPNGQSRSASLLFFEDQGRFIAISNETEAADMDIAMDSRDKIAGFVRGL